MQVGKLAEERFGHRLGTQVSQETEVGVVGQRGFSGCGFLFEQGDPLGKTRRMFSGRQPIFETPLGTWVGCRELSGASLGSS